MLALVTNLTNLTPRGMLAAFAAGEERAKGRSSQSCMKDADYKCPYCRLRRPPKDAKAEGEAQAGGEGVAQNAWDATRMIQR
jgi:hypothetical protein